MRIPLLTAVAFGVLAAGCCRPSSADQPAALARVRQLGGKVELGPSGRVVKVDLMDIQTSDQDVAAIAALGDLAWLRLWGPAITDDGVRQLRKLPRLRKLQLLFTSMTDQGADCLAGMTTLEALDLRGCARLDDRALLPLEKLSRLTSLKLQTPGVTDAGIDHLLPLAGLTALALEQAALGPAGLKKLAGLTKLEDLSFLECQTLSDEAVAQLAPLAALKRLSLRGTPIDGSSLASLRAAGLEKLDLSQTNVGDKALEPLARWTALKWLNLWCTQVGDGGLKHLAGLPKLAWLNLDNVRISDAGLARLARLGSLENLNLRQTDVSDAGLEHLKRLAGLKELNLGVTSVSDAGVAGLRAALPHCRIVR
jgi:Leucine-rich repeat (LRR) protein